MYWVRLFFNIFYLKQIEHGKVVYSNSLQAYRSSNGEITRQSHLKLSVSCQMEQDSVSRIMYLVHAHSDTSITGTGRFNTSMNFYTSSSFYSKVCVETEELTVQKSPLVNTSTYWHCFYTQVTEVPYEVTLNQDLYVQVELSKENRNLVLFLDTCVTSPSPHDFHTRPYYLVRNG